jgi:hypothetical protein
VKSRPAMSRATRSRSASSVLGRVFLSSII